MIMKKRECKHMFARRLLCVILLCAMLMCLLVACNNDEKLFQEAKQKVSDVQGELTVISTEEAIRRLEAIEKPSDGGYGWDMLLMDISALVMELEKLEKDPFDTGRLFKLFNQIAMTDYAEIEKTYD